MGLLDFFSKRWKILDKELSTAFEKVKKDRFHMLSWINYFRQKDIANDNKHEKINHELGKHEASIDALKDEINYLKNALQNIKISSKNEAGQVRTLHGTTKGHVRDMSGTSEITKKPVKLSNFEKKSLTGSQLEVLNLLYHSDRPLGYQEISRRLNKTEKSIRNVICDLRNKKIDIKDKPIGVREKGFFLEREEKIQISGR